MIKKLINLFSKLFSCLKGSKRMKYYDIVEQFRKKINDDEDFIIHTYINNIDNKNYWNCICSAMDWMTVASRYLDNNEINCNNDIDELSMETYLYISVVDIIWEAILQLHRIVIEEKTIPFKGENHIFLDPLSRKDDDNECFKHIRAAFGAHPVNLKDKTHNNERRFASWPTNHVFTQYDLAVYLYSSEIDKKDIVFGFKFEQLKGFLNERLEYLNIILNKLDEQKKQFYKSKSSKPIKTSKNTLTLLKTLEDEAKARFNNDYYDDIIAKLIVFFETTSSIPENDEAINAFRNELMKIVEEIFYNLQHMQFKYLKSDFTSKPNWYPKELNYEYSKLSSQVLGASFKPFLFKTKLVEFINQYLRTNESISNEELYLLANVGFFLFHKND